MKLDKRTVGKRYGKALYELAIEHQGTDAVYQELLSLREIFQQIPDLGDILSDVRLTLSEKRAVMDLLVKNYQGLVKNFLEVVYDYNRISAIPFMIDEYECLYDRDNGLIMGTVTTAVPLTNEQKTNLEIKVADVFGYKKAELTSKIDPAIIGGVIVEAQHQVIDGSLVSQLETLRAALKNH